MTKTASAKSGLRDKQKEAEKEKERKAEEKKADEKAEEKKTEEKKVEPKKEKEWDPEADFFGSTLRCLCPHLLGFSSSLSVLLSLYSSFPFFFLISFLYFSSLSCF